MPFWPKIFQAFVSLAAKYAPQTQNSLQKVGYVHLSPRCKSYKSLLTSMNSFSAGAQQRERWAGFIFPRPQPSPFLQRVVLSALYLGVGPKEIELVSKLQGNLASNPQLRVNFLLDCCRGRFSCPILSDLVVLYQSGGGWQLLLHSGISPPRGGRGRSVQRPLLSHSQAQGTS